MTSAESRTEIFDVTAEMTQKAQDPRCPEAFALTIIGWANRINQALADVEKR